MEDIIKQTIEIAKSFGMPEDEISAYQQAALVGDIIKAPHRMQLIHDEVMQFKSTSEIKEHLATIARELKNNPDQSGEVLSKACDALNSALRNKRD